MMKNYFLRAILFSCLLIFTILTKAEDIDLFVGTPPSTTELPNVLIVLDNTANWTAPFTAEKEALKSVLNSLPDNKFNVGLMMFAETGGGNSNIGGAYVRAAIRLLKSDTDPTKDTKSIYVNMLDSLHVINDKGNSGQFGKSMEEAYLYFSGNSPHAGNNKAKTDYTGNTTQTSASNAVYAIAGNALNTKAGSPYNKPTTAACTKNYIIYIGNGATQDSGADITQPTNALAGFGGNTTLIPLSPSGSQDNVADEWARFMKKSDLNITTFTVDINKVTTGQGPGFTALLKSVALQSDGVYFDVDASKVGDTLKNIFSQIQSVNSVFASVSLPVSVNTQGTFLNQVYIGMFRPDKTAAPKWNGNLKQYKLGFKDDVLQLLDADNESAINKTNTGFIAECARSFWTPKTDSSNYWTFQPDGGCLITNSAVKETPDGNVVQKGAQSYKSRSNTGARVMKTCRPTTSATTAAATSCSMFDFNTTNVTKADLGLDATSTIHSTVVRWQQGYDVNNRLGADPFDAATTTVKRPTIHGDVVHSRPIAINYGTDASPQVVVFYGGNDGVLRAVNGNRDDGTNPTPNIGSVTPGSELWSFVAPEFYSKILRQYSNSPIIKFPGQDSTITPTPLPKDYGVDGPVTGYRDAAGTTTIFVTLRRGGRALYAFDVTTPASPSIKWKIDCPNATNDTNCTTDFTGLGQTWSSPKVITSQALGLAAPMLIMGGGYDTCHDDDTSTSCVTPSKGKKVYIINANTGALLKAFDTANSVIGDITVVPDTLGNIKYAYLADLGGNVYRISGATANAAIGLTTPANWTMTKIASLGGTGTDNRKFMFGPDVLDDSGTYYLLVGSGDREKPLAGYLESASVANRFYFIKDNPTESTWLSSESTNCGSSIICHASLLEISTSATPTEDELKDKKGWYLALSSSEKVVTSAITVFGTVTFSTHKPTPAAGGECSTLGTATVYNVNYINAAPSPGMLRGQTIIGGGLPPSPVAGLVTLDDGRTVPFLIGGSTVSPLQGSQPPLSPTGTVKRPRSRVFWNIKK